MFQRMQRFGNSHLMARLLILSQHIKVSRRSCTMESLKSRDLLSSLKLLLLPAHPPSNLVPLSPGSVGRPSWVAPPHEVFDSEETSEWQPLIISSIFLDSKKKSLHIVFSGQSPYRVSEISTCMDGIDLSLTSSHVDTQQRRRFW